ncbi:hypothetical protein [Demequina sp.]|uniref:hypothetical protein n=1 Tax=Demequina sp. TaxID=2050685 RepID=UPI003D0ADDF5
MASRAPAYPFAARSNAYLQTGQFWPITLSDGRFAAGVVLAVPTKEQAPHFAFSTKSFIAGVLDWVGSREPTAADLAGAQLLTWGSAHVKTIGVDDGLITGRIDHELNQIRMVSHTAGGTVWTYSNGLRDAPATDAERRELPVMGTWGYRVAKISAERRLVTAQRRAT